MLKDYKVKQTLDSLLLWVTGNESSVDIPTNEKFLYRIFNGEEFDGYNFLEQARSIVLRTSSNPNKVETRLQFDPSRATTPTIHVTLPADNIGKENTIGTSIGNGIYENVDGTYRQSYARGFNANYDLMITSANPNEVALIYELLMHLFIAAADTLYKNFDLFTYKGREVMMNNDMIPDRIFTKVISLNVEFTRNVPAIGYYGTLINEITSIEGNPTFTLTVTVVDNVDTPIEGVNVLVGKRNTYTDASGIVTFTLLNGTYDYTISDAIYVNQTGEITINNDNNTLDITLIAI